VGVLKVFVFASGEVNLKIFQCKFQRLKKAESLREFQGYGRF